LNRQVGYGLAVVAAGVTVYYAFPLFVAVISVGELCPYSPAGTTLCSESSVTGDEPEPAVTEAGLRYRGRTADGAEVCFTLTRERDAWVEIGFLFVRASRCPEGATGRTYVTGPEPLPSSGRLATQGFTETIRGTRATGVLGDTTICANKRFKWNARLVP
jgi:hypothetical protein